MHRFFVKPEEIQGNQVCLSAEDSVHAVRVLRMHVGDAVLICDGNCHEYQATILKDDHRGVQVQLSTYSDIFTEPDCKITLFQGYPKADKMKLILQKGTELGISAFAPFYSTFCDVRPNRREKNERYDRIVYEAAKQSGRGILPIVQDAISWEELLIQLRTFDCTLLAYEAEEQNNLRDVLSKISKPKNIALIVGPEGGFSEQEIKAVATIGVSIITLGKRILRTETAGIVFPALTLYELGEMV